MPKPVPKKKKPVSLSTINRRLDILVSRIVRKRDERCVICGQPVQFNERGEPVTLTNGHWIRRGLIALRWDLRNCNCQCATCNGRHEYDTEPYDIWMVDTYGADTVASLRERSRGVKVMTRNERLALEDELRQVWEGMR